MKTRFPYRIAPPLLAAMLLGVPVFAHDGATGIVKMRMDMMEELGDASKRVGDMLKGKTAFERVAVRDAAALFVEHGKRIPELFPDTPESRTGGATEALASVWERRDAFERENARFVSDSEALLARVDAGDDEHALKRAFLAARRACSGCHDDFREERR